MGADRQGRDVTHRRRCLTKSRETRTLVAAAGLLYLVCALLVVDNGDLGARANAQQSNESSAPLKPRVARRLAWDRKLAPFRLDVEVNGAVVKLIGAVATGAERQRADRIAHDVKGVLAVVNGLKVDPALVEPGGVSLTRPDDNTLEKRIADVIDGDARVAVENIRINVDEGHVLLRGRVPDLTQQVRAGRIARSLFGVRSVDNRIGLVKRARRPKKRRR